MEAALRQAVAPLCAASGYEIAALSLGARAELTLAAADGRFVVWLAPAGEPGPAYRRTARFRIGHRGEPPDAAGRALLDALCARLAAWDASLSDGDCVALFRAPPARAAAAGESLEWRAVRLGLKPAAREVVHADAVAGRLEQARAAGLQARATEGGAYVARFWQGVGEGPSVIVHVAAGAAAVEALADAEGELMRASTAARAVTPAHVRAVGRALGYPDCCIDAFLPMSHCTNAAIRFAALRRTTGTPALLLNDLLDRGALVSHLVCRYDCAASLRYAEALRDALGAEAARDLERRLGGCMVAFYDDGALRLAPAGTPDAQPYRFEAVEVAGGGPELERWRAVLTAGDGLEIDAGTVRVLRGSGEIARLAAPADRIQVRRFT